MTIRFCVSPDNADLIAESLVARSKENTEDLARWVARLHVGRGQYRLDALALEDLRTIRRLLTEIGFEIDGITNAHKPQLIAAG